MQKLRRAAFALVQRTPQLHGAGVLEQLKYREENRLRVANFNTTRSIGENKKVLMDETAGLFTVSDGRDLPGENPDILAFADITGCTWEVDKDRTEIMREGKDGEEVSYDPPRYTEHFDFYVTVQVNNPYFDEMRFRVNPSTIDVEPDLEKAPRMQKTSAAERIVGMVLDAMTPDENPEYSKYKRMCEEMCNTLQAARLAARVGLTDNAPVVCSFCGKTTVPTDAGCCEFCGGAVKG